MKDIKLMILVIIIFISIENTSLQLFDFRPLSIIGEQIGTSNNFEDITIHFIDLAGKYGFPAEEHQLETDDFYRLRIHRIPGSPSSPKASGKPIVFIQHGMLGISSMFVLGGPNKDLAFILADAGYDVWLGNTRGNTYSRSHATLSPDRDSQFWEFSFHEMALYDLPTAIDYILGITNQTSLVYIGHSMGSTMSIVLLSMKPEYNKKIHLVINMAGIYTWKEPRPTIKFLRDNGQHIKRVIVFFGINELFPHRIIRRYFSNSTYCEERFFQSACLNIALLINGYNSDLDLNLFSKSFPHFPAGISRKTAIHFHQNMLAGKLQMFDYGYIDNMAYYGSMFPPAYNIENVLTRVVMIYGKKDTLASPEDSIDLSSKLKNSWVETVPFENFSHIDYIWGKNMKRLIHDRILQIIVNN